VKALQRQLVRALLKGCRAVDDIKPRQLVYYTPLRWLGCPRGLAHWSDLLDQRWGTGVWKRKKSEETAVAVRQETNRLVVLQEAGPSGEPYYTVGWRDGGKPLTPLGASAEDARQHLRELIMELAEASTILSRMEAGR
jgi:hypothetical protein